MAFGLKTGTFTSPHLFDFSERFRIDGVSIDETLLAMLVDEVDQAIVQIEAELGQRAFGAFEAQFALAALFFQRQGTEFNVFEAGIGGRYDATRLVEPKVSCVVSLDLEHAELLGNTLELICHDKSDVAAIGGQIVYGESCLALRREITQYNHLKRTTPLFVGTDISYAGVSESEEYLQFDLTGAFGRIETVRSRLHGSFQLNNAAVAALTFWLWLTGRENCRGRQRDSGSFSKFDSRRNRSSCLARTPGKGARRSPRRRRRRAHAGWNITSARRFVLSLRSQ